jgi:hypothetical protein
MYTLLRASVCYNGDMQTAPHPAKFSDAILPQIGAALAHCDRVLDPFAGTGKLKTIRPDAIRLFAVDIKHLAIALAQMPSCVCPASA